MAIYATLDEWGILDSRDREVAVESLLRMDDAYFEVIDERRGDKKVG